MIPVWRILSVFAVAALLVAAKKPAAKPGVDALAWLAGRWEFEQSGRVVREEWMAPAGGTMLGMSRTVKGGKTIEYEFLQIREGPGGGSDRRGQHHRHGQQRDHFRRLQIGHLLCSIGPVRRT